MDTNQIIQSVIVGGAATTLATQLMKNPLLPIPAEKYPRLTAAAVALIASAMTVAQAGVAVSFTDIPAMASIFIGTLLVASITYNQLVKKS